MILCVYAISKKDLKPKRKTLFDLRLFHLSQGEEKGERGELREEKQRRGNTLTEQIVIHLVRVLPGREKEYSFCKQGKITPSYISLFWCKMCSG
ncbi:MAG TPA: hypothetical protein DHW70_02645 [Candidatus Atribacteria bacterium]|nr:hypothetical protein [Candidatus Atribacteria bacterium]